MRAESLGCAKGEEGGGNATVVTTQCISLFMNSYCARYDDPSVLSQKSMEGIGSFLSWSHSSGVVYVGF